MALSCLECGRKLKDDELETGFCADCNAKIENDLHILNDGEDGSFVFLPEVTL